MTPPTPKPPEKSDRPSRLNAWFPGVGVLRTYHREWLPRDLAAGLVLSVLLVPQGMAYAELLDGVLKGVWGDADRVTSDRGRHPRRARPGGGRADGLPALGRSVSGA